VNMTAGKRIELLPGFETKTGAIFTASINNINCTNGFRIFSKDDIYDKSFDNLTSSINLDSLISSKVEVKEQSINNYSISIFPNPTAANINITQLNNFVGGNIEIINLMGQVIFTTTINTNQLSVNLSEYPKGIYLVKINSDKEQVIEKIVLE
ncbi:MAG TPA: T9SS type A sorting domain-containing protein, partial [Vicingaceae bacterium]|nr:T9SS type A sorting domain-containing protein [Vicingaceae bacterium]